MYPNSFRHGTHRYRAAAGTLQEFYYAPTPSAYTVLTILLLSASWIHLDWFANSAIGIASPKPKPQNGQVEIVVNEQPAS